ncbi:P12 family lipoprotein [Borrelia hermsii]|nr:P12 family lipoprotein [Borrelia hermsii]
MKKSILAVCMFILLCLLSCDINALNDLLGKVGEKFLDENKNDKDHRQGNQEEKEQEDVISNVKEREIQQDIEVEPVAPVNAGISVSQQGYPYYIQEEKIEIKEEDLIPSTKAEKDADRAIENIKSAINGSKFDQLIEESHKLQSEFKQLEFDFYDIMGKIQSERTPLIKKA